MMAPTRDKDRPMEDAYAIHEGAFGRAIVLETRQSLVAHSHSESQLALWLGGARAVARIGSEVVAYSEDTALGSNAFELHDMTLLDEPESRISSRRAASRCSVNCRSSVSCSADATRRKTRKNC